MQTGSKNKKISLKNIITFMVYMNFIISLLLIFIGNISDYKFFMSLYIIIFSVFVWINFDYIYNNKEK